MANVIGNMSEAFLALISNGKRTEWSPVRSLIIRVITKSDDRAARVRFVYHTQLQLWMWLVDLNYISECDWLIELSDNKLSNNKQSKLVENRTFLKPITIEEIVIFMIINITAWLFLWPEFLRGPKVSVEEELDSQL